jgi:hypothetical protein
MGSIAEQWILVKGTHTVTANNRFMEDDAFTYTYDDEGNRTSRVRKTSGFADKTMVYTWDYRNRLTQVENKNDAGAVTMRVKYQYDAWDRMTRRVYDQDGDTGSQALATESRAPRGRGVMLCHFRKGANWLTKPVQAALECKLGT